MTSPDDALSAHGIRSRLGRQRLRTALLLGADLFALLMAWVLAVAISAWVGRFQWEALVPLTTVAGTVFTLLSLLVVATLALGGQYVKRVAFWEETRLVWRYAATAALLNFALNFFLQVAFTRTVLVLAWLFVFINIPLGRLIAREWLIRLGAWKRRALLVGDGALTQEVYEAVRHERHVGIDIAGVVGADTAACQLALPGVPVHALDDRLEALAGQLGCEVIVLVLDDRLQAQAAALASSLHAHALEVFVVPPLQGLPVQGMQAQHFFSNDVLFLRLQHKLLSPTARWLKRLFDIAASLGLLVVLSPLMAFVAWRIWREDGGPVLYTQPRVGKGGLDFEFIKFRSMVRDADARLASWREAHPELYRRYEEGNFKLPDDPRVLRVGRWIRRTSVDELPQLWNVLRGDMSLVGPRPLLRRELGQYPEQAMALYEQVLPGITGLWQVGGRSHTTFEQRAAYDGWYVRNWSLWVDWVILLKTVRVVLSGRGAM
jgi:undecaprenyl-phosphate galactose phosphotransferase